MDVREAIRRRRMHRTFRPDALEEDVLADLTWAATRAPMGGAELVRRIVVISDPAVVRTVREVTPSFLANAPAILLICTDLERAAAAMGEQGREILSLLDAGAAAENVALAATALGLGVCFVRSVNDAALRAVLGLPAHVRPDLLIGVGHPSPTPSPAIRQPEPVVYQDRFGNEREHTRDDKPPGIAADSPEGRPVAAATPSPPDNERFRLALYLVASARDCLEEPLIYGPFRMIEGVSRLLADGARLDHFLSAAKADIEKEKYNVMADRQAFGRWLDDLLARFATEAARRNGVEQA
jgi:nitroreductase